jgi:ABC-type lipoprotein export system ATPase subunit
VTHESYTAEYAERIVKIHDGLIESDKKVAQRRRPDDGHILK